MILSLLCVSSLVYFYSPRYAQVNWDKQDFELTELYSGSYATKDEDSIETKNSEFDSIFNSY